MLQLRTMLNPADNCGAKKFMIIGVSHRIGKYATVGDVVMAVVEGADPNGIVADKEKLKILIVRTKKEIKRRDGTYLRFDDNAAVAIDKNGMPRGTRILGPIAREVKEIGYTKIASLAREVV
ncbi:MAG: 50S ribosomal protein L14 [Candidatus Woesebacteria bacterium GW2011_GWA1_37_8]|uniref:Large ribosomal subunit protein uL14 n=2 Tax=Candidatus Woeseibacteriota TaxID=1752722 RepID=A0A0G0L9N7_9BACT|nr:MAG: 50S ribosomal protein L14 [Microgenomates group bacterium GW2011_GWC1_37_12b]KKQ45875.1 MAG: 50S ribosomal protein L14 [Candidatus Woesebacteria bacterium GW2011_GWA1_37_8]KKQ87707.1 MAG: 50S ribosomal protein L14 [Candidatus Woesebacteria bacterium GW2011_GWB1_38_8b]